MLIGSVALLALALLVVLGPLIVDTLATFFPLVAQAHSMLTFAPHRDRGRRRWPPRSFWRIASARPTGSGFRDILPGVAMTFVASIAFGEDVRHLPGDQYLRNYIATYAGLASVMMALV